MPVSTVGSDGQPNLEADMLEGRRVHFKDLRIFKSRCIANRPTERGEPFSIWEFFQNLAGKRQDERIESIRLTSSSASACECQPEGGGPAHKVKRLCVCSGSVATITFLTRSEALKLTQLVRYHRRAHPGGATPLASRAAIGHVNHCDH